MDIYKHLMLDLSFTNSVDKYRLSSSYNDQQVVVITTTCSSYNDQKVVVIAATRFPELNYDNPNTSLHKISSSYSDHLSIKVVVIATTCSSYSNHLTKKVVIIATT